MATAKTDEYTPDELREFSITCESAFQNLIGFQSFGVGPNNADRGWLLIGYIETLTDKDGYQEGNPPTKKGADLLLRRLRRMYKTGNRLWLHRVPGSGQAEEKRPLYLTVRYDLWDWIPDLITYILKQRYRFTLPPFGVTYRPKETFEPLLYEARIVQTMGYRFRSWLKLKELVTERKDVEAPPQKDLPPFPVPSQLFCEFAWQTEVGREFARDICRLYPDGQPTPDQLKAWNCWKWAPFHQTCRRFQIMHHSKRWWLGLHPADDPLYQPEPDDPVEEAKIQAALHVPPAAPMEMPQKVTEALQALGVAPS